MMRLESRMACMYGIENPAFTIKKQVNVDKHIPAHIDLLHNFH